MMEAVDLLLTEEDLDVVLEQAGTGTPTFQGTFADRRRQPKIHTLAVLSFCPTVFFLALVRPV